MRSRSLYKDNSLEIKYDALLDILYSNWQGVQTEETILAGYKKILQMIDQHSPKALLDDHSQISGLWSGASEWIADEWFPLAKLKGLQFIAFVYSRHQFSRLSTMKAIKLMNSEKVMGTSSTMAANSWLTDMLTKKANSI
jgi:hypothetical protein